jgi:hypothetical protein
MAEGNPDTGAGAAGDPNAAGSTDPNATGSPSTGDPVSLLTSRLNGQTAKVGELTGQNKTLAEEIAKRDKLIADLQSGKVSAEESAKALVEAKDKELATERAARALEARKAKFPESFSVLGDSIASLDDATLAASEARFAGTGEPPTPGTPGGNKSAGTQSGTAKTQSADDIEAELRGMAPAW